MIVAGVNSGISIRGGVVCNRAGEGCVRIGQDIRLCQWWVGIE